MKWEVAHCPATGLSPFDANRGAGIYRQSDRRPAQCHAIHRDGTGCTIRTWSSFATSWRCIGRIALRRCIRPRNRSAPSYCSRPAISKLLGDVLGTPVIAVKSMSRHAMNGREASRVFWGEAKEVVRTKMLAESHRHRRRRQRLAESPIAAACLTRGCRGPKVRRLYAKLRPSTVMAPDQEDIWSCTESARMTDKNTMNGHGFAAGDIETAINSITRIAAQLPASTTVSELPPASAVPFDQKSMTFCCNRSKTRSPPTGSPGSSTSGKPAQSGRTDGDGSRRESFLRHYRLCICSAPPPSPKAKRGDEVNAKARRRARQELAE